MHHYQIEYPGDQGGPLNISFTAFDANGALDHAMKIAPGKWARLRNECGVICEIQRLSHDAVSRVAHPANHAG